MVRRVGARRMISVPFRRWFRAFALGCVAVALVAAVSAGSAKIVDSGSTNTSGYTIVVQTDGSASIVVQQSATQSSTPKAFTLSKDTATKLFADLAAARTANAVTVPCMKSASFGTTLRIAWQGWTSPDLSCPAKDALGAALISDVQAVREASGIGTLPLRHASPNGPPR
jgi:hypothetical protein